MASYFGLRNSYESPDDASRDVRNSLLGLFVVILVQSAMMFFFWYVSTLNTKETFAGWPNLDGLFMLILAAILLYRFSRPAAIVLLAFAVFRLVAHWAATDFGAPPGISVLIVAAAAKVAFVAFKVHAWEKRNQKLPRSKWTGSVLAATTIVTLVSLVFPPVHLYHHIHTKTMVTKNGDVTTHFDAGDRYSVDFPLTWQKISPHHVFYGSVAFMPMNDSGVRVEVERWQPYSIAPVTLFTANAFLKMTQDEAAAYASENDVKIDSVEMVEQSTINRARVVYTGSDGSKKYVYYIYNKAWSSSTSDATFFFWRIIVDVPQDSLQYDNEAQAVASSFTISPSR